VICLFVLLQFLDGLLTYVGMTLGVDGEGNPPIASLMSFIGIGPALLLIKTISVLAGIFIYHKEYYRSLLFLNCMLLFFAVIPWTAGIALFLYWN